MDLCRFPSGFGCFPMDLHGCPSVSCWCGWACISFPCVYAFPYVLVLVLLWDCEFPEALCFSRVRAYMQRGP